MNQDVLFGLISEGKSLFQEAPKFLLGVASVQQLPLGNLPEIAFAGRSNVGKSSLINAISGTKDLARVSSTPGRTQQINFFNVKGKCYIADLPGYGYAKAPKETVNDWTDLIQKYLKGRPQLKRVFLLIDSRHGIKKTDEVIMDLLDKSAVLYQIILTKTDKITPLQVEKVFKETQEKSKNHVACYPRVLTTSAEKKDNLDLVRASFIQIIKGL